MNEEQRKAFAERCDAIRYNKDEDRMNEEDQELFLAADAELTRLRLIVARVEDVEGMARVIHETEFSTDYDSISEQGKEECNRIARAVRDYVMGEG